MDIDDDILRQETSMDQKEELEMLQEFDRRRKFKEVHDVLDQIQSEDGIYNTKKQGDDKTKDNADPTSVEEALKPNLENNEIYDHSEFTLMFLDADMVCNMTRLNRVYERRCLLYIGNKKGLISYAIGRGPLYEDAFTNGYKELKKNMICISVDSHMTCPRDLKARFNDYRLYIKGKNNPKLWGNPLMCLMLRYAGLYHVEFNIVSRKKEPYAMCFAFFKAVIQNRTPTQVLENFGEKSFKYYIGRPRRFEETLKEGIHV